MFLNIFEYLLRRDVFFSRIWYILDFKNVNVFLFYQDSDSIQDAKQVNQDVI